MNPPDLKYSKEHEWLRVESDNVVVIGITEFAAESLGDVVFVELPDVGADLSQFDKMGEIESVKAVSDLFTPVGGKVLERNELVIDSPQLVNENSFDSGWMLRIQLSDPSELDKLMSAEEYEAFLASEEH
ncbi:MAG: glycine cleavage system protein GcvH [Chloroflexi bacterium]|nr:glycine cleavage system protein GcvH [Chloroflexota bacterium]